MNHPDDDSDDAHPPHDARADFTPPAEPGDIVGRDDEHLKDSVAAQELYDRAVSEAERGNEDGAVVHFIRASKLAEAAREWYLAAAACHRVGDVYSTPGGPYDLARAVRTYHRAIAAYHQCGLFKEARHLAYRVAGLQLWRSAELGLPWWQRVELFLFWAVAGFGFRPARVLLTAAAIVFGYAVAYWALDGIVAPEAPPRPTDFRTAVYFSGVTFSTVGYGDLVPAPHARMLAMSEGMVGFVTVSFFVVVLANRLRA